MSQQLPPFGTMQWRIEKKLQNDNDAKVLVVGDNSQTGIGKTTFAIGLCRAIDPEWSAAEKSFISVQEYINAHQSKPAGSALLLDEIEHGADSRRSMSQENVDLSQAWAKLRARNIATVATAPTISMVDSRMEELADWWVLVKRRGIAQPYHIEINNFNGVVSKQPLPGDEHIQFPDLPDGDADKEYLDEIKEEAISGDDMEYVPKPKHDKALDEARGEARQELRDEIIADLATNTELTREEIGELDPIGLSRQRIQQIVPNTS